MEGAQARSGGALAARRRDGAGELRDRGDRSRELLLLQRERAQGVQGSARSGGGVEGVGAEVQAARESASAATRGRQPEAGLLPGASRGRVAGNAQGRESIGQAD